MTYELHFRPEALADLEHVARTVRRASGSRDVAGRYVGRVLERCRRIAALPYAGRPRGELAPGLRSLPFERRLVIYQVLQPAVVEITNVFYGSRNYAAFYKQQTDPED